jgi:hypothetical protein
VSDRLRVFSAALQIITVVVVLLLLVYVVVESQDIAEARAQATIEEAERNRALLRELQDQAEAIRRSQADQRRAFAVLARRFEVLHGNDPEDAPTFGVTQSSNPPTRERSGTDPPPPRLQRAGEQEREQRRQPREQPRRPPNDPPPDPPAPTPPPTLDPICVPLVRVCIGDG